MKKIVAQSKVIVSMVDPIMIMGMHGISTDTVSKVLVGVGMAGLVTAVIVTPVLWVKGAVVGSIGCFTYGFVRGVRKSMKTTLVSI